MPITASTLKPGSLNLPKLIRHLSHRTDQVKTLSFKRDSKHPKSSKATGQSNSTKGSGSALAGPAVNFGYEDSDSTTSVLTPSVNEKSCNEPGSNIFFFSALGSSSSGSCASSDKDETH